MAATPQPTLRDFQFVIQLLDAGLIQATFKFADLRAILVGFGQLTPDTDAALKVLEANPQLIALGIADFKAALAKYPLDTPLSEIFGSGGGGGGAAVTLTPEQVANGVHALEAVLQNAQKAFDQFITTPAGIKIANELYAIGQALTQAVSDYNAHLISSLQLTDKVVTLSAGNSALAVQALQFLTGAAPTKSALDLYLDNPNSSNDLTDVANLAYSVENRYLKFLADQVHTLTSSTFAHDYGGLSFADAVAKIYDAIIGNAKAAAAGIDVGAALAYVDSQQAYFTFYGGDGLGAKAAAAGFLMSKGLEQHVGLYSEALHTYFGHVLDGSAAYGTSILPAGAPAAHDLPLQ